MQTPVIDKVSIKKLPRPAKIETTKALQALGFSQRRIMEICGLDLGTVNRYVNAESDKNYEQFGHDIKKLWLEQDAELAQIAVNRIKETSKNAKLYQAIGLLKTVREFNIPRPGTVTNVQSNTQVKISREDTEPIVVNDTVTGTE